MNGELKLESLLENFDAIHSGSYQYHEEEIETTEGDFVFVDIDVMIDVDDSNEGNVSCSVYVECLPEYFTLDRWGEEREFSLEGYEMVSIENKITKSIEDKLK
jgi:hypothetical protein